jgi:hypothetical protein
VTLITVVLNQQVVVSVCPSYKGVVGMLENCMVKLKEKRSFSVLPSERVRGIEVKLGAKGLGDEEMV